VSAGESKGTGKVAMKLLYLMRHAKSSRGEGADFERPLAPRGRRAAARMGEYMLECGLVPDFILCSAARRARETLELAARRLGRDVPTHYTKSLYLAEPARILKELRRLPDAADAVLAIGHNPGLQELAVELAGEGAAADLARLAAKFPTGAFAVLRFAASTWRDIGRGGGRLELFVGPRELV